METLMNDVFKQRLSANISILFTELPFLDRFAAAARAGFKAVECWFPYEHPAAEVKARLDAHGLLMIGINTSPGDTAKGQFGLAAGMQRTEFRASALQAFAYANVLGCANVHVLSGMGDPQDEATRERYLEGMAWAADEAAKQNITALIEPLNPVDRPGYYLSRQSQALEIVQALQKPNLKIMFDVYHVQMTEGRIVSTMLANLPHIGHIQIADVPGRHEPGTGEIRFDYIFDQIKASGWLARGGWIGCEYKPKTHSDQSQGWILSIQ
jgi:2-dehydrotetronate isomerase